jgi:hypothetical protein
MFYHVLARPTAPGTCFSSSRVIDQATACTINAVLNVAIAKASDTGDNLDTIVSIIGWRSPLFVLQTE